jgi:hypothetical protein
MSVLAILGTIGVVGAFILGGLWLDRRVSILPRGEELAAAPELDKQKRLQHAAGAAPETAVFADAGEIEKLARRARHCRARMTREDDDEVVYDDRTLTVLRFRCGVCGERGRVYIARP